MKDRSEGGLGNESQMREKVFERERDEILVGGEERESVEMNFRKVSSPLLTRISLASPLQRRIPPIRTDTTSDSSLHPSMMGCLPSRDSGDEYKKVSESIDEMIRQSRKDFK
jgi:hypothetical protein